MSKTCTCKFVAKGQLMDSSDCEVHPNAAYPCGYSAPAPIPAGVGGVMLSGSVKCLCSDYRPNCDEEAFNKIRELGDWPRCVCGHIAQEH
jgi:hypothetical protein